MLTDLLTEDVICIYDRADDWKDAIKLSCKALVDKGAIEPRFIDAILRMHQEIGPYYVIGPGIAMPHARPEDGVNKMALAITVIKEGVIFNSEGNDPVKLLVTLAAIDSNSHINTIAELAELFMNDKDIQLICDAQNPSDIVKIIQKY